MLEIGAMRGGDVECDPALWPAWTDDGVWNATDMVHPLTPRQGEVYAMILELTRDRGIPPTNRELSAAMGSTSPNGAFGHLRRLRRAGWLKFPDARFRSILPRFGRVAPRGVSS